MTVYELQHVTVTPMAGGNMFKIKTDEGWCLHCPEHDELVYKTVVILRYDYDFSTIQIIPVTELPEGAEVLSDDKKPETETM